MIPQRLLAATLFGIALWILIFVGFGLLLGAFADAATAAKLNGLGSALFFASISVYVL